jgi:hypothetical protein
MHNQDLLAGTGTKPAADIAAQTAAALALIAKHFTGISSSGAVNIAELVPELTAKAEIAYQYATAAYEKFGDSSSCSTSGASTNCVAASGECKQGAKGVCLQPGGHRTVAKPIPGQKCLAAKKCCGFFLTTKEMQTNLVMLHVLILISNPTDTTGRRPCWHEVLQPLIRDRSIFRRKENALQCWSAMY